MSAPPRPMSLCRVMRFAGDRLSELPETVVFLGEIPNMAGHAAVADTATGRMFVGLHLDRLVELTEDET
jgi:hypothetical protein